jgi:hypothetical protein
MREIPARSATLLVLNQKTSALLNPLPQSDRIGYPVLPQPSVMAPLLAVDTSLMYFAITPRV